MFQGYPSKEAVEQLREQFPNGCRVALDRMEDMYAPKIGTEGTVTNVDDVGTIHVNWDEGGSLGVVYGVDRCHKI